MFTYHLYTTHKNVYRFDSSVESYIMQHEKDSTQEEFERITNEYRYDTKRRQRPLYEVVDDLKEKEGFRISPTIRF